MNRRIAEINADLWIINSPNPWYCVDQWAINAGRSHLYNDAVHYARPLTNAGIQLPLNYVCPEMGEIINHPDYMPTDATLHRNLIRSSEDV